MARGNPKLVALLALAACSGEAASGGASAAVSATRVPVPAREAAPAAVLGPYPIEIEVETDAGVPLALEVWITASDPSGLVETGDMRLLPDTLEWAFIDEPAAATGDGAWQTGEWAIEVHGARATLRTTLCGAELGRAAWVCLTSENTIHGFAPRALPLEAPRDPTTSRRVRFEVSMRGGLRGVIVDEDAEAGSEFSLRLVGAREELYVDDDGAFVAWPLPEGRAELEIVRELDQRLERQVLRANVGASRLTDLGTLVLHELPVQALVRAVDPNGAPLDFFVVAALADRKMFACTNLEAEIDTVELRGRGWEGVRLDVEPSDERHDKVRIDPFDLADGRVELVLGERASSAAHLRLSVHRGDERFRGGPILFARSGGGPWQPFRCAYIGCTLYEYDVWGLPSGFHELLVWSPKFPAAAHEMVALSESDDEQGLDLALGQTTGTLRGTFVPRVRGHLAHTEVTAWIQPAGAVLDAAAVDALVRMSGVEELVFDAGEFTIPGVPAELSLELVLIESEQVVATRPLRLAAGQVLDLGTITFELP